MFPSGGSILFLNLARRTVFVMTGDGYMTAGQGSFDRQPAWGSEILVHVHAWACMFPSCVSLAVAI